MIAPRFSEDGEDAGEKPKSKTRKNLEIERLRGAAVLMATLCHFAMGIVPVYFIGGWQGVDLFFVISGCVIAQTFLRRLPKFDNDSSFWQRLKLSKSSLRIFFIRRVFRILPQALLWLAFPILISLIFSPSGPYAEVRPLLKAAFEVVTLRFNYIPAYGGWHLYAPYWSLMVEEHFYIIFPFLMIFLKNDQRRIVCVAALTCIFAFVVRQYAWPQNPNDFDFALHRYSHMKFDALFAGVVVTLKYRQGLSQWFGQYIPTIVGNLTALAMVMGVWSLPRIWAYEFIDVKYTPLVWIMASVAVYLATLQRNMVLPYWGIKQVLEYLGSRSYAIYLAHFQILRVVNATRDNQIFSGTWFQRYTASMNGYLIAFLVLTGLAVELSYRLMEKPLNELGRQITRSPEERSE